jgi:beta-glucosidase
MFRTRLLLVCLLIGSMTAVAQTIVTKAVQLDQKLQTLLKSMTTEEKVGQMTQVVIDVVSKGTATGLQHELDPAKLENAILKHNVGSILNVNGEAYSLVHWRDVINQIQDVADRSRLKIPIIYGIDSIHGATYTRGATLFPQAIAMAATWNPSLATRAGEVAAVQTRASGIPWSFYPVLDIGRMPLWPRFWETYGEDVLLATEMGKAYIAGMQGNDIADPDRVLACLKHSAGYSAPKNGQDRTPASIDERELRQYYLPMFEAGVKAGVLTVMVNSGEINGVPGHANYHLLTDILKRDWGFQGFVVSDWEDIKRLYTRDHIADSPKEAVRKAVMAGVDMSMVPMDFSFYELLLQCVKDGSVPMSRIDDAVRRILRVKMLAGLFEQSRPISNMAGRFNEPSFEDANLNAAREAITLLKNKNNILPLRKGSGVLVTGPNANLLSVMNGGWTITWQGDKEDAYPTDKLTIERAIEKTNLGNTIYLPPTDIPELLAAAQKADVIVVALGEKAYCETPGNIGDLTIDADQRHLVAELAKTGKPIVTVLTQGRPRVLDNIAEQSDAIVMAYLPGMEGGRAIAEILFGETNPSGKLPFTYPRHPNGFTTYDYKYMENLEGNKVNPQWEFGYGLSYTTFQYSNLKLSSETLANSGTLTVSVDVKNTGERTGREVVQLYVSDLYRSNISPPNKELKGFRKIDLRPGESQTVSFALKSSDLAFVAQNLKWVTEPGKFGVRIASLTGGFTLK